MQVQSLSTYGPGGGAGDQPGVGAPLLRGQLGFISDQLGMSQSDLETALRHGASVDSLARQKGVSTDGLRQQVAARIQQARQDAGLAEIAPARLDQVLTRAFSQGARGAGDPRRGDPHAAYGIAAAPAPEEDGDAAAPGRISIYA